MLFVEFADHHVHEREHELLANETSRPAVGGHDVLADAWAQSRGRRGSAARWKMARETVDDALDTRRRADSVVMTMRRSIQLACERMAAADGVTNDAERAMLARIAAHLKAR